MTGLVLAVVLAAASDPGADFGSAVERHDLKAVTALLDAGHSPDTPIGEGEGRHSPLQRAAWNGATEIAKLLIERGADVNASSAVFGPPLYAAATRGWDDLVAVLLQGGAAVDQRDQRGNRALSSAVSAGNRDMTTMLLNAGAKIEESEPGYTPLMYAATNDDVEMIRLLVKSGARINAAAKGEYGAFNPLLIAVERGHVEAVKVLIELKANLNVRSSEGETALQLAKKAGNEEIVTILKRAGATEAGSAPRRKP